MRINASAPVRITFQLIQQGIQFAQQKSYSRNCVYIQIYHFPSPGSIITGFEKMVQQSSYGSNEKNTCIKIQIHITVFTKRFPSLLRKYTRGSATRLQACRHGKPIFSGHHLITFPSRHTQLS